MKTSPSRLAVVALAALLAASSAPASEDALVTAVYSSVHNGYHREKQADGTFKREYYALARGEYNPGIVKDASIDAVGFPALAGVMARYLAGKDYFLAEDSKSAGLLLVVTWGTTVPLNDGTYRMGLDNFLNAVNARNSALGLGAVGRNIVGGRPQGMSDGGAAASGFEGELIQMQMFESMRRQANEKNARILGYVDEINYRENPSMFMGAGAAYRDLFDDLENERYYVVISAYDFKTAKETGQRKLLWATRVSIQAQGNRFDRNLASMLSKASRYFGRNSGRLQRQYDEGIVTIGEMQIAGYEDPAAKNSQPTGKN